MEKEQYILKLDKMYVGDSCIQIMIPYDDVVTIFDSNKVLYHYKKDSECFVNEYLNDERRHQFPYSNIPMHIGKIKGHKLNYVNMLYDYYKPYIVVRNDELLEYMAIKDNDGALLISKDVHLYEEKNVQMTREEIYQLFEKKDDKNVLLMKPDGAFFRDINDIIPDNNNELKAKIINKTINIVECFMNLANKYHNYLRCTCNNHEINKVWELRYIMESKQLEELINFEFVLDIINDDFDAIIKSKKVRTNLFENVMFTNLNGNDIKLDLMKISYIGDDKFNVCILNAPINYSLDYLKYLESKLIKCKQPKISPRLNPSIKKEDLKQAKRLVKEKKKTNN